MAQEFSEQHRVVYYDTEVTGEMGIGKLVDMMMLASEDHSYSVGVTTKKVLGLGLGWVITQHLLTVNRLPKNNEVVTVKTKAASYNPYFCYRDFWVKAADGTTLAKMHTVFVLMDQEKRKITRIVPELVEPFESEFTKKIERNPLPKAPQTITARHDYGVRFMDIDSNHHVNNVHYFDWMLDVLGADFLIKHRLKEMNIQYKQEVRYGQVATSEVEISGLTTNHQIKVGSELSCLATCQWEER
ncbi:thioesterase [Ligilactobacillus agilis]|nr:thioesterase [Ligilactobacillus agilis]